MATNDTKIGWNADADRKERKSNTNRNYDNDLFSF